MRERGSGIFTDGSESSFKSNEDVYKDHRKLPPFPDKKHQIIDYRATTDYLKQGRRLLQSSEVGQLEATWRPQLQYPHEPFAIVLMSDMHYGSTRVDYDLLEKHLGIVDKTPNMFLATNGDHVDNFNAVKHPTGMTENPVPPQIQSRAIMQELLRLDKKDKVACIGQGNHDDFGFMAGQDFWDTFTGEFKAPIFSQGGILNIDTPTKYRMVLNHTYWGRSKINITNAAKRLAEYEGGGDVDIAWVGHTHQSSYEHFTKGDKELVAVVSGTYKTDDAFARKHGIGGRGGHPGITVVLWPTTKKMEVFKDCEDAQDFINNRIKVRRMGR